MSHFDVEAWSDYVRGTASSSQVELMRRHLDQGCSACSDRVATLEAVQQLVDRERKLGLDPGVVRSVKAMFRQRQVVREAERPASRLQLVFDSRMAPLEVGVRNSRSETRQLMYMSGDLSLGVQLVPSDVGGGPRVVGEIVARDSGHLAGAPVTLLAGDEVMAEGVTGPLGEFDLPAAESDALKLRFELEETVELELPPN